MARPRKDGEPPRPVNKRKLSPLFVTKKTLPPGLVWDTDQKGLALSVQPSGHRSYKVIYSHHGRPRWYHIADANAIGLADARKHARRVMNDVAEGRDPQAERKAQRWAQWVPDRQSPGFGRLGVRRPAENAAASCSQGWLRLASLRLGCQVAWSR